MGRAWRERLHILIENGEVLVSKEITDAVGATDDFGIWFSTDCSHILITKKNPPLFRRKSRSVGRQPKHNSNIGNWDEKRNAYVFSMDKYLEMTDTHLIPGERIDPVTIVFDFLRTMRV